MQLRIYQEERVFVATSSNFGTVEYVPGGCWVRRVAIRPIDAELSRVGLLVLRFGNSRFLDLSWYDLRLRTLANFVERSAEFAARFMPPEPADPEGLPSLEGVPNIGVIDFREFTELHAHSAHPERGADMRSQRMGAIQIGLDIDRPGKVAFIWELVWPDPNDRN